MHRVAVPAFPPHPPLRAAAVAGKLRAARADAFGGHCASARRRCAELMIEHLPALAAEEELLRGLLEVLLHARGYAMLGRVLAAMFGRDVGFLPLAGDPGFATPRLARVAGDQGMRFAIDEGVLGDPGHAALVRAWSVQLIASARGIDHAQV